MVIYRLPVAILIDMIPLTKTLYEPSRENIEYLINENLFSIALINYFFIYFYLNWLLLKPCFNKLRLIVENKQQ